MTCRCPLCGEKNASRKSNGRGLYIRYGIVRDERNRRESADTKKGERRLLRHRMKAEFRKEEF